MTAALESFAASRRLRIVRDAYGRRVVPGRGASLIAEYGNGRLSVLLMGTRKIWWTYRRRALIAAGCRLEQCGDTEGSLSFDPSNDAACAAAIKAAGCKHRRIPSPAQLAVLVDARAKLPRNQKSIATIAQKAADGPKNDDSTSVIHPGTPDAMGAF